MRNIQSRNHIWLKSMKIMKKMQNSALYPNRANNLVLLVLIENYLLMLTLH